jgi:hypothetical protein
MLQSKPRILNTIVLTIGLCLSTAVLIPAAEAALTMNGHTLNGIRFNGVNLKNSNLMTNDASSAQVLNLEGGQLVLQLGTTQP